MIEIHVITRDGVTEEPNIQQARKLAQKKQGILWVDLRSYSENEVHAIAREFNLHTVAVDSVLNPYSRPHLVEYEDHFHVNFTLLDMPPGEEPNPLEFHVFLSQNFIITASTDGGGALVDQVLSSYREVPGLVERGTYYILYLLVELLIDTYFPLAETLDDQIDELEDDMLRKADERSLRQLLIIKRRLFHLRRYLGPQRDILNELARRDFPFLKESYQVYFQDVYNRMIRVFDVMDTAREIVTGALDIYQSTVSNRLNDIMKILTVFAAILGTLTLITGFFGMNFAHLPWLQSRYAFSGMLISMGIIVLAMLAYFRWKKWL